MALASCAEVPPPPPPVVVQAPIVDPSAAPTTVATAPPAPTAEPDPKAKPAEPPAKPATRSQIALTLRPGDPPCTLALDGERFSDHPEWFEIDTVSRMATEAGGACVAGVFYDLAADKKKPDAQWWDDFTLAAGIFAKPGQKLPPSTGGTFNVIDDLDFDGYADLCVVVFMSAYNYVQKCWLFDPAARTFVRNKELDAVIHMTIDRTRQVLTQSMRVSGPVYADNEYAWLNGKLVQTVEQMAAAGEKIQGGPLPKGATYHLIRKELRNGRLVKVREEFGKPKP
jgi:hypothetical protein